MKDLTQLTRFEDRVSFLYLEKGHIEQHQTSVAYVTERETVPIPAASLALLMLGPGITITHAAIRNLADCNCLVAWCGDEGTRFYCFGRGGTHLADKLLRQAEALLQSTNAVASCAADVREAIRGERWSRGLTLEQIRGREGYRVRNAYRPSCRTVRSEVGGTQLRSVRLERGGPA